MPTGLPTRTTTMHTLTLGATGMLANVTRTLALRGRVDVLARHPHTLQGPNIHAYPIDWRTPSSIDPYLAEVEALAPIDLAVLWLHRSAGDTGLRVCRALHPGHVVHVLSSAATDPSRPQPTRRQAFAAYCGRYTEVILGFRQDAQGSRWLTDAEICHGTLCAIDGCEDRVIVGRVAPWSARPR